MKTISFIIGLAVLLPSFAQRVGIGTSAPAPRAILHLESDSMGFLPPRLTQAERDAIPVSLRTPGLMIYNKTTNCMEFWNGSKWISMCASDAPCQSPPPPTASSNAPICTGQTLNLSASNIPGATYVWTGPNGFYSTDQNPTITNAQTTHSGTYCVRVSLAGCWSDPVCVNVTVNPLPGTWTVKAPNPPSPFSNRYDVATFAIGEKVYFVQGRRYPGCCNRVDDSYVYDVTTNTWSRIADPPGQSTELRFGFSDGTYGYVSGGYTTNKTYRYDPTTNTWSDIGADLPCNLTASQTTSLGSVNRYHYIFGGNCAYSNCPRTRNSILRIDPTSSTPTWQDMGVYSNDDADRAEGMFAIPLNGYIYIGAGGSSDCPNCCGYLNKWYRYDPNTGATTYMGTLPFTGYPGNRRTYIYGNYGYAYPDWRLNATTETWEQVCVPPMADCIQRVHEYNGKYYFISTCDANGDGIFEVWEWEP